MGLWRRHEKAVGMLATSQEVRCGTFITHLELVHSDRLTWREAPPTGRPCSTLQMSGHDNLLMLYCVA